MDSNEKLDKVLETVTRIDERMQSLTKRVEKLETWTDKHDATSQARNWQLWFGVIFLVLGGISGWLFAILRT